jgi:hypothetical protein
LGHLGRLLAFENSIYIIIKKIKKEPYNDWLIIKSKFNIWSALINTKKGKKKTKKPLNPKPIYIFSERRKLK